MIRPFHLLLLFVAVAIIDSLGNNTLPLIDRDEPRFAEASREMRQSGDFVIPRVNGEYRFDKPPLIYWCQVSSTQLFGESDFSVRLPSVLFAAATAVLTAIWGARLYGPKIGLCSGIIFGTCLQLFIHGRAAVADMPMIFFFLSATWVAWERITNPKSRWLWLAFYISLALGFLAKGPIALLPVLFPAAFYLSQRKGFSFHAGSACLGVGLLVLIVGAWGIPALIATKGEFFAIGIGRHVVMRSVAPMQSHGGNGLIGYVLSLPFYLVTIFFSFFPWCFYLPGTIARLRRDLGLSERYLLGSIALVFLVFTLIQTKLPHYTLPAFPLLAILTARQLNSPVPARFLAGATIVLYALVGLVGFSWVAPYFPSKAAYESAKQPLTQETRVAYTGYDEQSLVWYFRYSVKPFLVHLSPPEVPHFLESASSGVCVVTKSELAQITIDPGWKQIAVSGFDFARWKIRHSGPLPLPEPIDLVVLIKMPAG
ncbi:MAG: glycosyltransferase family 39 protein [Verrucomicrobia bacterium]|nr:glycosyltransferase family 39 protein [Verrucomicrobiota bacterium]MBV8276251.1 glycosyltransferase family 39 protein [Verrucomicrobiota bacterium]